MLDNRVLWIREQTSYQIRMKKWAYPQAHDAWTLILLECDGGAGIQDMHWWVQHNLSLAHIPEQCKRVYRLVNMWILFEKWKDVRYLSPAQRHWLRLHRQQHTERTGRRAELFSRKLDVAERTMSDAERASVRRYLDMLYA